MQLEALYSFRNITNNKLRSYLNDIKCHQQEKVENNMEIKALIFKNKIAGIIRSNFNSFNYCATIFAVKKYKAQEILGNLIKALERKDIETLRTSFFRILRTSQRQKLLEQQVDLLISGKEMQLKANVFNLLKLEITKRDNKSKYGFRILLSFCKGKIAECLRAFIDNCAIGSTDREIRKIFLKKILKKSLVKEKQKAFNKLKKLRDTKLVTMFRRLSDVLKTKK